MCIRVNPLVCFVIQEGLPAIVFSCGGRVTAAEDPISEHRNHVSDAVRVKAVCWRGSPDPLQRPRPARLLGEGLAGSFKRLRSPCGRSHRSDRRNRPQRWSSSRLCRVHPALDRVGAREGQLPLPNTPSGTDDAGGRRRAAPAGRPPVRPLLLSRAVAASVCASPPPNGLGALARDRCMRIDTERSEARYREDARPRYRAVGPHGKRTIRESIPRGIEFPLSVYRGSLWTREGHIDPATSYRS